MKTYVKPEINFENFKLSTHIASCAMDMNSADVKACSAIADTECGYPSGVVLFVEGNVSCAATIDDYCYTNGTSGFNLFNS